MERGGPEAEAMLERLKRGPQNGTDALTDRPVSERSKANCERCHMEFVDYCIAVNSTLTLETVYEKPGLVREFFLSSLYTVHLLGADFSTHKLDASASSTSWSTSPSLGTLPPRRRMEKSLGEH